MLSDEEAEAIRRRLADGWRGPVLLLWLERLLQNQRSADSESANGEGGPLHSAGMPILAVLGDADDLADGGLSCGVLGPR